MTRRVAILGTIAVLLLPHRSGAKAPPCRPGGGFGGHPSWETYKQAFATAQCDVCGLYGFQIRNYGCEEDFEAVGLMACDGWVQMIYAHRPTCLDLGTRFPHLRKKSCRKRGGPKQ